MCSRFNEDVHRLELLSDQIGPTVSIEKEVSNNKSSVELDRVLGTLPFVRSERPPPNIAAPPAATSVQGVGFHGLRVAAGRLHDGRGKGAREPLLAVPLGRCSDGENFLSTSTAWGRWEDTCMLLGMTNTYIYYILYIYPFSITWCFWARISVLGLQKYTEVTEGDTMN